VLFETLAGGNGLRASIGHLLLRQMHAEQIAYPQMVILAHFSKGCVTRLLIAGSNVE